MRVRQFLYLMPQRSLLLINFYSFTQLCKFLSIRHNCKSETFLVQLKFLVIFFFQQFQCVLTNISVFTCLYTSLVCLSVSICQLYFQWDTWACPSLKIFDILGGREAIAVCSRQSLFFCFVFI